MDLHPCLQFGFARRVASAGLDAQPLIVKRRLESLHLFLIPVLLVPDAGKFEGGLEVFWALLVEQVGRAKRCQILRACDNVQAAHRCRLITAPLLRIAA